MALKLSILIAAAFALHTPGLGRQSLADPSPTPPGTDGRPNQSKSSINTGVPVHVVRVPEPRQPGPPGNNPTSPNPASNSQVGVGIQFPLWGGEKSRPRKKSEPAEEPERDDSDE